MPNTVRQAVIALLLIFFFVGATYRIRSQNSGERLDRTKEGWPLLIGIRLFGALTVATVVTRLADPAMLAKVSLPMPEYLRWTGVALLALTLAWLLWMFHSLGRNLTDTVVARQDAYLVHHGPYRYVRNPMYTGVCLLGLSLGLATGTWLIPLLSTLMFTLFVLRTPTEERYLLARFGDDYQIYMNRVGRFAPRTRIRRK